MPTALRANAEEKDLSASSERTVSLAGRNLPVGVALGVLALVAALATVAPTARALRVDPAVALRHE